MMLHTRGLTLPYWKYGLTFRNAKIPPMVCERVIVRVGAVAECEELAALVDEAAGGQRGAQLAAMKPDMQSTLGAGGGPDSNTCSTA